MKIRRATLKDLGQLVPLNALFVKEMRKRFPEHFLFEPKAGFDGNLRRLTRFMVVDKASVVFVAEDKDQFVGFIHATLVPKKSFLYPAHKVLAVEDLFVLEKFRNSGIATRLFSDMKKYGVRKKCALIQLSVLPANPAKKAYEQWGFRLHTEKMTLKL